MKGLIEANVHYLKQAAELVDRLNDGFYARSEPIFYNSTIGGHLRHCLEHYESFTQGLLQGRVDYDVRHRDEMVENRTQVAHERIGTVIAELLAIEAQGVVDAIPIQGKQLLVKMDCGGPRECGEAPGTVAEEAMWQVSSVGRELQFLVSHTVHHFAMIRGICQSAGEELNENFGMAPSTLRHRKQCIRSPASGSNSGFLG